MTMADPNMAQPHAASPSVTVATYEDYASAQQAVDYLSDRGFPVEHAAIVGTDLRLVERVLGRMTVARAAASGALGGAWLGLLIGLLIALFADTSWWAVLLFAVLFGAVWGAIFGAVAHAMTRGERDFSSVRTLQAGQYAVTVRAPHADAARELLAAMPARSSP